MPRFNLIASSALALVTMAVIPAVAAAQSGPWQHAREPRDRSLSCEALETEIGEIDVWRASNRDGAHGSGVTASQGVAAAEVAARRTGNRQTSGMMRDAQRLFGGSQQPTRPARQGPDPDRVASERRGHLMSLYERNSCAAALGEIDQAGNGPWLAANLPRDPALSCDALEVEIGNIDAFIAAETGMGHHGASVDADQVLDAGQSAARHTRNYETSGILGDARRVLGSGAPARQPQADEGWRTGVAYDRRSHLMNLFERRDCW